MAAFEVSTEAGGEPREGQCLRLGSLTELMVGGVSRSPRPRARTALDRYGFQSRATRWTSAICLMMAVRLS